MGEAMTTATPLEPGMLLLDPGIDNPRPIIWTVKSVAKKSATCIAWDGHIQMEAKLRTAELPEGWTLYYSNALAAKLCAEDGLNGIARRINKLVDDGQDGGYLMRDALKALRKATI